MNEGLKANVCFLWECGHSASKIAGELNISLQSVLDVINLKLPFHNKE